MNRKPSHIFLIFALLAVAGVPAGAFAEGFSRQGIFGCNDAGAYSMSVGSLSALGGTFVPVSDAAVTLNTGYLVYKECVLRPMVNRLSENATANLVKQTVTQFNTGRTTTTNGVTTNGPMFPANLSKDMQVISDNVVNNDLNGSRLNMLSPAFSNEVKTAVYRNYQANTQNPSGVLACPYARSSADLKDVQKGVKFYDFNDVLMLADSNCIPLYAYNNAQNLVMADVAAKQEETMTRLNWSNGVYDVVDSSGNVVTPGFLVAGTIQQQLGAGFQKQQNANDIDQMVGQLFAGIGNQILSSASGLIGLLVSGGGNSPSYMNQVVADSSQGLKDSAINAALQILIASRQIESAYLEAENGTAAALYKAITQLREAENQCWSDFVIPKVKEAAGISECTRNADGTQTCNGSISLKIATSTVYSQRVIDAQIGPLASTTALRINASSQALASVDKLIADVQNSQDLDAQSTALQQLDALVAQKALHNQNDLAEARQQQQDVNNSVANMVTNTIKAWGDSTDPNIGWCNVNNPAVIQNWTNKWKI
ncbi:MAG: hypothetical protein NUV88_01805 [Candidatus Kaiserbacteria bacterium]|nr:hypothetical protein [Candidatus Kaiserbacteria bacterium]